jgi:hypothetical protein
MKYILSLLSLVALTSLHAMEDNALPLEKPSLPASSQLEELIIKAYSQGCTDPEKNTFYESKIPCRQCSIHDGVISYSHFEDQPRLDTYIFIKNEENRTTVFSKPDTVKGYVLAQRYNNGRSSLKENNTACYTVQSCEHGVERVQCTTLFSNLKDFQERLMRPQSKEALLKNMPYVSLQEKTALSLAQYCPDHFKGRNFKF